MADNWIDAMIERFKNSTKGITKEVMFMCEEDKRDLVKKIDHEAFETIFILSVYGVLDIGIKKRKTDIRKSPEYKVWHKKVLRRDRWVCQDCGGNKNLEVHHIKPIKYYPELAITLSNGLTLCHQCHKKTDSYGYKVISEYGKNYRK